MLGSSLSKSVNGANIKEPLNNPHYMVARVVLSVNKRLFGGWMRFMPDVAYPFHPA